MLRSWMALLLLTGMVGCTTALQVDVVSQPDRGTLTPRPDACEARLYDRDERPPESCVEVGDVFVGDTGWTVDCGERRVQAEVRRQACRFGADAAQVVRRYEPSFSGSSCDQIRARFLKCSTAAQ